MGRKQTKPRWLHHCHKSHQTLVMQAGECQACGRTRTVQAEVRYSEFSRESVFGTRTGRSEAFKGVPSDGV